jgi:hypothetical protein
MMKKIFFAVLVSGLATAAIAQDATTTTTEAPVLKSKKGEAYLPVTDEWALGVSANPFLDYLGNFLNGTDGNNAPEFEYPTNPASRFGVFGKLMKDEKTAYRLRFNLGIGSRTNKAVVNQNELNPDPAYPAFTEDWQKVSTTSILIAPGIEKRRGSTRLQGVYGAELVIGYTSSKTTYEYGNSLSADFPNVVNSHEFGNNNIINGTTRATEDKTSASFLVGARGFIGVEYFIAPKISLGGEFGYLLGFETLGRATRKTETWDAASVAVRNTETDVLGNNGFSSIGIGLDNLNGSINLLFYF